MNTHLSARQRRILFLERQVEMLQQMQHEYNVFLNYVVAVCGKIPEPFNEHTLEDAVFTVHADKLKLLKILTIRTEFHKDGTMTIIRVPEPPEPVNHSRIILP